MTFLIKNPSYMQLAVYRGNVRFYGKEILNGYVET